MAYDSRVYRILIASPSDVEEEREINPFYRLSSYPLTRENL
jgi:hypothetical protein